MKISTRIALIFSSFSSLVLITFGLSVYYITKSHIEYDYTERIKKRVDITENFFLEKDSFTAAEFKKIKNQFLHTLNDEKEEVIELKNNEIPVFKSKYSEVIQNQLCTQRSFTFIENRRQGASKIFNIGNKKYLIIVTAYNEQGAENLSFLLSRIWILIILGIPILYFLSIFIARRTLSPISEKIDHANRISASNLHERLTVVNPKDELGQMAIAFNNLLDRLEKSFESQKSFIANASHEIKNPLTAIMGEAEIASSRDRTGAAYLESFQIILSESERLNLTVNNLLQLSKVTANDFSTPLQDLNFHDLISQLVASYSFVNPDNQLALITCDENCKDMRINGNRELLKTAIVNILDNACKFSENKKVTINIQKNEDSILLTVSDLGIGIPEKDMPKITAPFYRASNTIAVKGSGIGLSLTKKIIQLHKGTLSINSRENIGTEVLIVLPFFED